MSNHTTPDIAALNPYRSCKLGDPSVIRISNDLLRSDLHRIRSVVLDYGFINGAISRFVKHLAEHCEQHGYSYTDRDKLITYVTCLCFIGTSGISAVGPAGPTPGGPNEPRPNVDGRQPAQGVGTANPGTANVERVGRGKPSATKGKSGKGK